MSVGAELGTRAVVRPVEPGNTTPCDGCGGSVKYQARQREQRVVANVYENGAWDRVEHFHLSCYVKAGQPHGQVA